MLKIQLFCLLFLQGLLIAQESQEEFYPNLEGHEVRELACDCYCHTRSYLHKQCEVCKHFGGKFQQLVLDQEDYDNDSLEEEGR